MVFAGLVMLPITGDGPVSRLAGKVALPLRQGKGAVEELLHKAEQAIEGSEALEKENTMLKAQLAQLEREVLAGETARNEAERLRALLGFSAAQNSLEYVPVRVVSREGDLLRDGFTLVTEGEVASGDWIITEGGELLGVVETAGEGWCTARTLLDPDVTLSVWVGEKEVPASFRGSLSGGGRNVVTLEYLPGDGEVSVGDLVVTAGLGGGAPSGLTVGKVVTLTEEAGGLTLTAEVEVCEAERGMWGFAVRER